MAERGRPRNFNRENALTKAMELFWERGYENASMSELTSRMGIGTTSLYAAFGSKEALFKEAMALYCVTDGAAVWAETLAASTAYGAVEALLMSSAREFSRADKPSGCLVVLAGLISNESDAPVRSELIARRQRNVEVLTDKIACSMQDGKSHSSVELEAIARYYITVQQGMSVQARDGADRPTLESIARHALAAWAVLTGGSAPTS
jgi:AcrR family transcriptional regulator